MIKARLPAEAGAVFLRALAAVGNALPAPDVADVADFSAATSLEPVQSRTARRADALALMAEGFLASEQNTLTGGDRQQIVVHVDAQTFKHDHPGRCELAVEGLLQRANRAKNVAAETSRGA